VAFEVDLLDRLRLGRKAGSGSRSARPAALLRAHDTVLLGSVASAFSIVAWLYFNHEGLVLVYQDAISHMEIARRVVDSTTPGFGQLGGVWLPLPHLLMMPLIWINALYYSGFAGSAVSMAAYVVTSVLVYKIAVGLTGKRISGLVGSLVFMANPGVLYLQSTPMTESLMFACMAGIVYGLQRWIETDDYRVLLATGVVALLGTLTRYEIWVILAETAPLIAFLVWRRTHEWAQVEGTTLAFMSVAGLGIAGWLAWNQLIFGNALNWEDGKYAKPSLWISSDDAAVGHWVTSLKTYWYAMTDDLGNATVVLAAAGLVLVLLRRQITLKTLPTLSLLGMFPFFVYSLESGQRPLHVLQINHDLYNVRFGLVMTLPAAMLAALLTGTARRASVTVGLSCVVLAVVAVHSISSFEHPGRDIAVLQEPLHWRQSQTSTEATASSFLHSNYNGGRILAQFFGNEDLLFAAHISLDRNVYEGSNRQWLPALANPVRQHIQWIVMRKGDSSDQVTAALARSPKLKPYRLVYRNSDYRIYERA
jgi:Dolichyl-phosphate-mannose-protein mannosyltransferase